MKGLHNIIPIVYLLSFYTHNTHGKCIFQVVRAWVDKVRTRLRSLDDETAGLDDELAWLANGGEFPDSGHHPEVSTLDSDGEEKPFGTLQLGEAHGVCDASSDAENNFWSTRAEKRDKNKSSNFKDGNFETPYVRDKTAEVKELVLEGDRNVFKSIENEYDSDAESTFSVYTIDSSDDDSSCFSDYESAVAALVESLSTKHQSTQDFNQLFDPWRDKRFMTLHTLRSLADDLEHHRLNVNISVVTGSSVGATGGVVAIVGMALAPETLGVSLILTAVGTAASIAGGVTALGSNVAECVITKKRVKVAQEAIDEDALLTNDMHLMVERITKSCRKLQTAVRSLPNPGPEADELLSRSLKQSDIDMIQHLVKVDTLNNKPDTLELASSCVQVTAAEVSAVGALEQGITRAVATAAEDTSIGLSVAARAAGITFSALSVGLDLYKIITTSIELAEGSQSGAANHLRKVADDLEKELDSMTEFYDRLHSHCSEENDDRRLHDHFSGGNDHELQDEDLHQTDTEYLSNLSHEELDNSNNEELENTPLLLSDSSVNCSHECQSLLGEKQGEFESETDSVFQSDISNDGNNNSNDMGKNIYKISGDVSQTDTPEYGNSDTSLVSWYVHRL